jgi:outer membrane protein assembly factor BamB
VYRIAAHPPPLFNRFIESILAKSLAAIVRRTTPGRYRLALCCECEIISGIPPARYRLTAMTSKRNRLVTALFLATLATAASAADWPQFRGPNATGMSGDKGVPVKFGDGNGILWKVAIPGAGNSSPIVSTGRVFIQSASLDGKQRMLFCLDAVTGKTIWTKTVDGTKAHTHLLNTLASSTAAADGERVYTTFWDGSTVLLTAFDYEGKEVWRRDLGPFRSEHGFGASPVVFNNRVYVNFDQDCVNPKTGDPLPGAEEDTALLAFQADTGRPLWRRVRHGYRACYSEPIMRETANGGQELVVVNMLGITAYDPATGKETWSWDWPWPEGAEKLRTVATPVVWKDVIFVQGGNGGGNSDILALRAGGPGISPKLVWEKKRGYFSYVPCMLVVGDRLFTVHDKTGIAGCYDAATGKEHWNQRLSGEFRSSPVLIDGKVYLGGDRGDVYVFPAKDAYEQLARNPLGEGITASPAVADGRLYIRGKEHLFCIGRPQSH